MKDEPTLKNKLSPLIAGQLPDFLQSQEHANYSALVRDFYQFLESARMTFSFSTNYLIQEPNTKSYVLKETEDRIVLEDSTEFLVGETVKGQTSGAEATVLVEDVRNSTIYITSNQRFEVGEQIKGLTSNNEAELVTYKANPVQNIQQLLEYADIDNTVWEYFDQFREAFLAVIPNTLADGVSKRKLIKNIRDLYTAKGTREGHKLFMRLLLNETANIFYPQENMLRVSDGEFKKVKKLRCLSNGTGTADETINQIITGRTSGATATVDGSSTFQQGDNSVNEFSIEDVQGTFQTGEIIDVLSTEKDVLISFTIKSIVTDSNITNDGILHSLSEALTVDSTKGNGFADILVDTIKEGSVSEIYIDTPGSGYETGDTIQFTGGANITPATGVVTATGGGFQLEDGSGSVVREDGTTTILQSFNIALESTEISDGPYYVFGTTDYGQRGSGKTGYYYPLYLTAAGAGGENNSHKHTFFEYPGIDFFMPNSNVNHAVASLPTGHSYLAWPNTREDRLLLDGTDGSSSDAGDNILTNTSQASLDKTISDSDKLILEFDTFATAAEATEINEVKLTNKGNGYTSLPTFTISTEDGTGAKLLALTTDIGAAESLKINDSGFDYNANDLPDVSFRGHFVLSNVSGTFADGNTLTSHTGTVKGWNSDTQQLDVVFEDIIRFDMEQQSAVSVPIVLEGSAVDLNSNNILMEDSQDVAVTSNDNIILDGTGTRAAPTRRIEVNVKYNNGKFVIDSVSQKQLKLKAGYTYYFDLSDPSLYNETTTLRHVLRFSETEDGTHGGGTEYTTGVTKSGITTAIGTAGAFIQLVIAANAPTLFYYDENFEEAGAKIEITSNPDLVDDEFDNILINGSFVSKFSLLQEASQGENPLSQIIFEDDSGAIILEESNTTVIQDVDGKVILDGLLEERTAFILNETSGEPMRTEDYGNALITEDGDFIISETEDSTSIGDHIILDGTDSSSNNAGELLINEERIDFSDRDVTITDSSGATGTIVLADIARGTATVGTIQETEGNYLSIQSLIDEDLIRIQDSYYYQQFSYEVQVGQSTASYLSELKKAVHPAGFAPFGKVSIASFINLSVRTTGSQRDPQLDTVDTFSPILASTFEVIFDELINRAHYIPDPSVRIGGRDDELVLDGTDGSQTDAGDNIIFEDGFNDGYGIGGRVKLESAHAPTASKKNVFIPTFTVTVESRARSR